MTVNLMHSFFFQKRIQIFCVLCQTKNFTETGRLLGITQPAVSKNIQTLEQDLGITLIEREKRPLSLTVEGKLLFDLIVKQQETMKSWLMDLQLQVNKHVPLRFGSVSSIARYVNVEVAQKLASVSNAILFEGYSKDLLKSFEIGDIDFFISSDPYWEKPFYRRFIFAEPSVLLVPLNFKTEQNLTWEKMQFCGLPRVANSLASTNGQFEQAYFASLNVQYVDRITVDGGMTFLEYIKNGLAWSIQTPLFIASYPDVFDKIQMLPMPQPVVCRELYLLARSEPGFVTQADKITRIVKETLITNVIPKLLEVTPWIAPYLSVPGLHGLERSAFKTGRT